jgi:hypothetical protein
MRPTRLLGLSALVLAICASAGVVYASGDGQPPANADITLAKGEINVKGHSGWHINVDYPWKIQLADGTKLDKNKNAEKFEFDAKDDSIGGPAHVKVHAPSGQVLISGAICSKDGGQCESFTKVPVTVP